MDWIGDGYTDLHSHLVPGVDDGSRTLDDARDGLRQLLDAGIRRVVTTPHLNASLTQDPALLGDRLQEMDEGFLALKTMAEEEYPQLDLLRGHEVMLDIPDPDLSDLRVHLGESPFVLVEWPGLRVPPSSQPVLTRLMASGVRPVLAHPERYHGLDKDARLAGEWRRAGALIQVNYGSLAGRYGDLPRRRSLSLLERGWVDLLATDFHGRPHLSPSLLQAKDVLFELGGGAQFGLLAGLNPTRILRGEDPIPVPPLTMKAGVWQRLRELFQT